MKDIYLMGICGTGMGNFALMLKSKGYSVRGSDKNIYPPMSTKLKETGVEIYNGFSINNLEKDPDLVIIGNVIRKDNVEAQHIINKGIKYLSMPEALKEFFFKEKQSIVISGTHGKTTTSFITAHILDQASLNPGYFIGGIPKNFNQEMGRTSSGDYFVIEGDEYDSVFYDKVPKFYHYDPKFLIISGIEFDHADIYKDIDSIVLAFKNLINLVPSDGLIIYNYDDLNIKKIINYAKCKTISFSIKDSSADYFIKDHLVSHKVSSKENELTFNLIIRNKESTFEETYSLSIPGVHNVLNACSSIALLKHLGVEQEVIKKALLSFKGVKRRLEVYSVSNGRIIIDDFAHHPSAVAYSIKAINSWYKDKKIWCIFEPRTATSRTNILEDELIEALLSAKNVLLAPVHEAERVKEDSRFNPDRVCGILVKEGINALNFKEVHSIISYLLKNVKEGEVVLIMSNGGFSNIYEKLDKGFKNK